MKEVEGEGVERRIGGEERRRIRGEGVERRRRLEGEEVE